MDGLVLHYTFISRPIVKRNNLFALFRTFKKVSISEHFKQISYLSGDKMVNLMTLFFGQLVVEICVNICHNMIRATLMCLYIQNRVTT